MNQLSLIEVQRLEVLESVIDAGLQTFVHVGNALLEIRDNRLYRQTHGTFEEYCGDRWQMSRPRVYQLMDAAQVVANLSTVVDITPTSERQARPLTILQPEAQREVWQVAVESAPNGRMTAAHVQAVVSQYRNAVNIEDADGHVETITTKPVLGTVIEFVPGREPVVRYEFSDNAPPIMPDSIDDEQPAEPVTVERTKPRQADYITLAQWTDASVQERDEWLTTKHSKATFNETNDNIEWAAWSWNPVTGCLHDCSYCYARDIANRFYAQQFTPSFLPERLGAPINTRKPDFDAIVDPIQRMAKRNVFVCSMADLFGKWVPSEWIESVLQQAWNNPQWTFLFLTKFPIRMAEFDFPPNSWIGTTVDRQWSVDRAEKAFTKIRSKGYRGVAWLSCEPMLERLQFNSLDMFDWVVFGGSSKSTQTADFRPPFEWIVSLWNQAKEHDIPVYMKTNLGIEQRVKEYPQ